jgi:hypothetical protein
MRSKSRARFAAAIAVTTRLTMMPSPVPWVMYDGVDPNRPISQETK